jgi:hypothetical protein
MNNSNNSNNPNANANANANNIIPRRSALALVGGSALALTGIATTTTTTRTALAAPPRTYQNLFRIERNKNANIVQYDAVLEAPDRLDSKSPVVGYWVLLAEDGRREEVTGLARRAYGFKVVPENGTSSWLLYLNATSDRSIRVLRWKDKWLAQTVIQGKNAMLTRLYVFADESAFIPSVRFIDLFGTDLVTGAALTERLKP